MAVQIGGTTVIDDSRNLININEVRVGLVTIYGNNGNVSTSGTVYAQGGLKTPIEISSFSPADGATNVSTGSSIGIIFDQNVQRGTGTITIREGSVSGTIKSSYNAASASEIVIQGNEWYLNPSVSLGVGTDIYLVVPSGAIKSTDTIIPDFPGVNVSGGTTYSFGTVNQQLLQLSPAHESNSVGVSTNITLTFNQTPVRGTGTVVLRRDTVSTGTVVETFNAATSTRISVSVNDWILDPTSDLSYEKTYFLEIPNTAIGEFDGLNQNLSTDNYQFSTSFALGGQYNELGGYLVKKGSGRYDIIAPQCAESSVNWYTRSAMTSQAQSCTGVTGWYVPSCSQLQSIGFSCRAYWDNRLNNYWSNTECSPAYAFTVNMNTGSFLRTYKPQYYCGRAFRCVTY